MNTLLLHVLYILLYIYIIRTNIQNTLLKYIVLGDGSHFYIPLVFSVY